LHHSLATLLLLINVLLFVKMQQDTKCHKHNYTICDWLH